MPVRTGSINASGAQAEADWFGATSDFNLSLDFGVDAVATIVLERRFAFDAGDVLANEGDRLLTEGGDLLLLESGDVLLADMPGGTSEAGFRPCDTFTADFEGIVEVAGPTEFRLNCTSFSAGPIEYRLG